MCSSLLQFYELLFPLTRPAVCHNYRRIYIQRFITYLFDAGCPIYINRYPLLTIKEASQHTHDISGCAVCCANKMYRYSRKWRVAFAFAKQDHSLPSLHLYTGKSCDGLLCIINSCHDEASIIISLWARASALRQYPWSFELCITYSAWRKGRLPTLTLCMCAMCDMSRQGTAVLNNLLYYLCSK